jgi:hypothetical protein
MQRKKQSMLGRGVTLVEATLRIARSSGKEIRSRPAGHRSEMKMIAGTNKMTVRNENIGETTIQAVIKKTYVATGILI